MADPDGFFWHAGRGGKKFLGQLMSEERKIKGNKFDRFPGKMGIFREEKDGSGVINRACRREK